jgi:hypothetical protein
MKIVSDKCCRENQNTQFMFNNFFLYPAVYEKIWKNIVEPVRLQMTIRRLPIPRWIPKATDTYSEHEILLAFPLHL